MNKLEIMRKIDELVNAGDEKAIEAFMLENFKDLPEETQGAMLLSYLKEALATKEADVKIAELQETAMTVIESLNEDTKQ